MPAPLGILADAVAALAPLVGDETLAAYLLGLLATVVLFLTIIVALSRSGDEVGPTTLLIASGIGIGFSVGVGLWDQWTLIFIGIMLLFAWTMRE